LHCLLAEIDFPNTSTRSPFLAAKKIQTQIIYGLFRFGWGWWIYKCKTFFKREKNYKKSYLFIARIFRNFETPLIWSCKSNGKGKENWAKSIRIRGAAVAQSFTDFVKLIKSIPEVINSQNILKFYRYGNRKHHANFHSISGTIMVK